MYQLRIQSIVFCFYLSTFLRVHAAPFAGLQEDLAQLTFSTPPPDSLEFPISQQQHTSTFTPLRPPAIPLAVRSPYLNAWLPTGYLAGTFPKHWPVHYPGSKRDYTLGWAGIIRIDGTSYEFFGDTGTKQVAIQKSFAYTAQSSIFEFEAANVSFTVTFLSPVTPHDLLRQSIPLSYLSVQVESKFLKKHQVSVYSDITGEWASGDSSAEINWSYDVESGVGQYGIRRKDELEYSEFAEQAEWGSAVYAVALGPSVSTQSGTAAEVRSRFVAKGKLSGSQDVNYRKIEEEQPVFGFAKKLSVEDNEAVFTIGHMRDNYVNYVTPLGQTARKGLWSTKFSSREAVIFWVKDFAYARDNSLVFDELLRKDAFRVSGQNYSAIVELSTRQAFATFEITVGDREDDVMVFLKEISSNGDCGTVDVVFPLHPILLYTNPTLLKLILEPIMTYTASGLYPNLWPVHDLGTYPNATGYNRGDDEPMPVEEAGNLLWMILAYWQLTHDTEWISKYYSILTQWTDFLLREGLIPAEQLSTDDFAGTLSNQTNLALKAIVGIGAMSQLSKATGNLVDFIHYDATARAYVTYWYDMALTAKDVTRPHAKLSYQDENSYGLIYNLFGDRALNLNLFDDQLYEWQSDWYPHKLEKFGVPLDSRHAWTKTDWEMFASASATSVQTRDMFINAIFTYLDKGLVDAPFPDLYETTTGNFPGRDGLDWNIEFIARPVVGGHFSLMSLEIANKANGVRKDPFRERKLTL